MSKQESKMRGLNATIDKEVESIPGSILRNRTGSQNNFLFFRENELAEYTYRPLKSNFTALEHTTNTLTVWGFPQVKSGTTERKNYPYALDTLIQSSQSFTFQVSDFDVTNYQWSLNRLQDLSLVEYTKLKDDDKNELLKLLDEVPIEDGYPHPAEIYIEHFIKTQPSKTYEYLTNIFNKNLGENPHISYAVLRCLGRLQWRVVKIEGYELILKGLLSSNTDIYEAITRAIESWKLKDGIEILRFLITKSDDYWLNEYIKMVIEDLRALS